MLLYQIAPLVDFLSGKKPSRSALGSFLQEKLKAGMHPFFLEQILIFVAASCPAWEDDLIDAAVGVSTRNKGRMQQVPPSPGHRVQDPLNRIYENLDTPRNTDVGIIHGIVVEACMNLIQAKIGESISRGGWKDWMTTLSFVCKHPQCPVAVLDNAAHLTFALVEQDGRFPKGMAELFDAIQQEFFVRRVRQIGLKGVVRELVETWNSDSAYRFFALLVHLFHAATDPTRPLGVDDPGTTILRTILDVKDKSLAQAKKQILDYPLFATPEDKKADHDTSMLASRAAQVLLEMLKAELPAVDTVHSIARLLKTVNYTNREQWVAYLAFQAKSTLGIDPRSAELLESLLGHEAWKALCELANPEHWAANAKVAEGVRIYSGLDASLEEYQVFFGKLRAINFDHHNARLAELVDRQVHSSGHTPEEARGACERVVNLLAGDTVFTSTHLRLEWMRVRRRADEFLGSHIPRIDVAIYRQFGESGTACKFRIFFTKFPDEQITGLMDPEGKVEFNNIAVLTPFGRNGLRAAVLESLGAILIPRYLERIPSPLRGGCGGNFTGEVWAARPTIHTLGQVNKDPEPQGPSFGNRINPVIAHLVFQWLMGEAADCPFRLYRKVKERVEETQTDDTYYVSWDSAKQQLLAERVTLSQVYLRTVRAHTKPVGVKVDRDGKVVVQQVSARARRNYRRFLLDTGRQLDMSPVRKTYELPGDVRIVLTLERTFNQGTFNSLDEVWTMIPDLTLKANAQRSFKF